jgi:hypothetical protein
MKLKPDFSSKDAIQDEFWWAMCDAGMSFPVPLRKADLSKEFVYDRRYGVFHCNFGKHQFVMALLLAWDQGVKNYLDIDHKKLNISDWGKREIYNFADYYLENTKGTCFLSSQSKSIKVGKKGNLNSMELDYFSPIHYSLKE